MAALLLGLCLCATPIQAQNETWEGPGADWSTDTNWSNDTEPTGIATFTNNGAPTAVASTASVTIGEIDFTALAPAYTFVIQNDFNITGTGIVNNSANVQTFNNIFNLDFFNASTAGSAAITNSGL